MKTVSQGKGLACQRCGGRLESTARSDVLRCRFCDTSHLWNEGDEVEALAPAGRLGRRRAQRALAEALRAHGTDGHALEDMQLVWLPFWQVEARLVGWLRYRPSLEGREPSAAQTTDARASSVDRTGEIVEEMVAREINWSQAACDPRGFGVLGIADRLNQAKLVSFTPPDADEDQWMGAVTVARSTVLRRAQSYHGARLAPRNARSVNQRLSWVRPRARLIYYPVWRLRYRVRGRAHEAILDGLRGHVLRGTTLGVRRGPAGAWLTAATVGGWLCGVSAIWASFGALAWLLHRASRGGVKGDLRAWGSWLGEQLELRALQTVSLARESGEKAVNMGEFESGEGSSS